MKNWFVQVLTVLAALTLTACPQEDRYTLTIAVVGGGSVAAVPASADYAAGAVVALTAVPDATWRFDHWEGHLTGATSPATVTMNANRAVTAVFVESPVPQYTLDVETLGNGTVTLDPSGGTYDEGTTVNITASGQGGWNFNHWLGDMTGDANPQAVIMDGDAAITAVFRDPEGAFMQYGYGILLCMDVSPDGHSLLTGGYDGKVRLWNADTGALVRTFYGHSSLISSLDFAESGDQFLSGSYDGSVILWDLESGAQITAIPLGAAVYSAVLSPDATRILVTRQDHDPEILLASGGATVATLTGHTEIVYDVAYRPDGAMVATASADGTARFWDAAGGFIDSLPHPDEVTTLVFSSDGTRLLTGCADGDARYWDVETGAGVETYVGHTNTILAVAFSPDGSRVLTGGSDWTARVWDTETGLGLHTFAGHERTVTGVGFSSGGSDVFTCGTDGKIIRWSTATGSQVLNCFGYTPALEAAVFSPDGSCVLTAGADGRARLYNADTGEYIRAYVGHSQDVRDVAFSPDGTEILTGSDDGTARLWDTATGAVLTSFVEHGDAVRGVAFSPDGANVATASDDSTAKIWHAGTGVRLATLGGHGSDVLDVAYSHDGTLIATASADHTAVLWESGGGAWIRTFAAHTDDVNCVAFSDDDTLLLTGSYDASIILWDVATAGVEATIPTTFPVFSAVFSPDEKAVVTANVSMIRAWEIESGNPLGTIYEHFGVVHTVAYAPDELSLLTAGEDGTAYRIRVP
ncbi:MAG TPA: hypothetical protein VMZ06_04200 [Candidatus Bathyarchaeia archaeon]|nr:hypothetical protein [Candidatus Bathyarchaeia archaeon]